MKKSIFEQSRQPADNTPATIPAMGSGFTAVVAPEQETYGNYIIIANQGKGKWSDIVAKIPSLPDGDAVLICDGEPVKLPAPFTFFLLDVFQYFCVTNAEHKPRKTWLVKPDGDMFEGSKVVETLSIAILVVHDGNLIPATFRVTKAMCKGVYVANNAVAEVQAPEWGAKSPDHAATLAIKQPNLRFKTTLSWRKKPGRGGFPYFLSSAVIHPATAGDSKRFAEAAKDEAFLEKLEAMREAFAGHQTEMYALAK